MAIIYLEYREKWIILFNCVFCRQSKLLQMSSRKLQKLINEGNLMDIELLVLLNVDFAILVDFANLVYFVVVNG